MRELPTLRRLLAGAGRKATPAALPSAEGRRSRAYVASLIENAGYRFDDVFVSGEAEQHEGDLAAARAELRRGAAPEAKGVARDALRSHAADARMLRKLGGRPRARLSPAEQHATLSASPS